jgi:hypothetical protein
MKAYNKIINKLKENREKIYFIHYSCQNLSDENEGYSPRITSIAVLHMLSSQMHSFSIHLIAEGMKIPRDDIFNKYNEIETIMLERFFNFISNRPSDAVWIHWNMTNINFGFETIEHRYNVLTGKEPIHIDEKNKFNLSYLLKRKYGSNYVNDPKMINLMELNGGRDRNFLTGEEEVTAYKAKEFIKLHNSTMCKVYFFRDVYGKMLFNKLRTNTNSLRYKINTLYQNPIIQIIGIIGIIGSIIATIVAIVK